MLTFFIANTSNSFSPLDGVFIVLLVALITYIQLKSPFVDLIRKDTYDDIKLRDLDDIFKPYLPKYFSLYRVLDDKNRHLFEQRVQKFIDLKQFVPRGIKEVTPEMKAMIAGSAIQLTFGYPDLFFRYFKKILIYNGSYYSNLTRKYHKGEVSAGGLIVLSWKAFKEGFDNPSDGSNLGLHEMAHALRLINIIDNDEYNFYDRETMSEFEDEAKKEILKMHHSLNEISIFRDHAVSNIDEFFSVAVECFFEKPVEFKRYNPKLYLILMKILKIDTVAVHNKELQNLAS